MNNQSAETLVTNDTNAVTLAAAPAEASTWDVDPGHASAQFKVRHLMVSHVRGHLGTVTGSLQLDERRIERSQVQVSIDATGIDTRNEARDAHLRSADFLDVAQHPTVTFRSTQVRRNEDDGLAVTGELTIRGVTRPVTLKVEPLEEAVVDPWGNTKRGVTARTTINRKDWGLTWNAALEAGGVAVADAVAIEIELELTRRAG